jgi:hypothetical protein
MGKVGTGPKVLVAAAFAPANLVLLGGSWVLATVLAIFVWWLLGPLVGFAGLAFYGRSVMALAGDSNFAQKALAAGDMGASSLKGSRKLEVLEKFGKLPPAFKEKVKLLQDLGSEVEDRLEKGAGSVFDAALGELAPQVKVALEEAVELAGKGAELSNEGKDTGEVEGKLVRIVEILESMKGDLLTMEGDGEALGGDAVVHRLEDLSSEVSVLKESLIELGG